MDPTVPELLRQGLTITVLGMGLVFAALGLLWAIMVLLARLFRPPTEEAELPAGETVRPAVADAGPIGAAAGAAAGAALTAERARVAAAVAGALAANAIPALATAPTSPASEHDRTAPIWIAANRARNLNSWQPPRARENSQPPD